ncbi:uncharacterized protein CTRU02_211828 [Colletotrichum truncatum]|uniref:Uncharacterized protein n=1 Tax=Colletotrichum truncatum TaxID=5467 RepID=A0ACC3YLS9_COLTU|nr:uncharacterized protein CTRU02_07236 [Colletotrichum truncatum]KAF6791474.1 hypothetical protein CTRU02_07236 [Colletotrichum truncatum]
MASIANHTWLGAVSDSRLRGSVGVTAGSTLLPNSSTAKGWLACVFLSLLNSLLDRVLRYHQKDTARRTQDERRRRRLGVWEERQHSGLEKLHEMLSELDIPEVDLNTIDMHEWLDYAFHRS